MTRFQVVEPEHAPAEVQAVYAEIQREFGTVPLFFKSMAVNPSVLRASWNKVRGTLLEGQVPRVVKEMIIVAVSNANRCLYCQEMHATLLGAMGVNGGTLTAVTQDLAAAPLPDRVKLAVSFGVRAATRPAELTDEDFDALIRAGFSQAEVLELVAVADLAVSLNTYADALALPPEEFTAGKDRAS